MEFRINSMCCLFVVYMGAHVNIIKFQFDEIRGIKTNDDDIQLQSFQPNKIELILRRKMNSILYIFDSIWFLTWRFCARFLIFPIFLVSRITFEWIFDFIFIWFGNWWMIKWISMWRWCGRRERESETIHMPSNSIWWWTYIEWFYRFHRWLH